MDFSRVEQQLIDAVFGASNAEDIFAGAVMPSTDPLGPGKSSDVLKPGPNSVGLAALLMLAKGLTSPEEFAGMRGPGQVTMIEVPRDAWIAPVTKALFHVLQSFGRTINNPRGGHLVDSYASTAKHVVISDANPDYGYLSSDEIPKTGVSRNEASILTVLATRRTVFLVSDCSAGPQSPLVVSVCDQVIRLAEPDAGIVAKMIHAFCREHDSYEMPTLATEIAPLQIAMAFRSSYAPERALELLATDIGKESPQLSPSVRNAGSMTIADLHGMDGVREWAENLRLDADAVRSGTLDIEQLPRGALVSGPPGVGKTRAARAIARHAGLPIVLASVSQWLGAGSGHLGTFCAAVRASFERAGGQTPCLLVIDEFDALPTRGRDDDGFWNAAVAAVLEAMDGLDTAAGIVVLGLCNSPEGIDSAIRRSGRLDHHITVERPKVPDLAAMFRVCLRPDLQATDFTPLAARVAGGTIADVDRICRDARRLARRLARPVDVGDLNAVIERDHGRPLVESRMRTAVHEAGHALIAHILSYDISHVSLFGSGLGISILGSVATNLADWAGTPGEVHAVVGILLAGRAAESVMLGVAGFGAGSDIEAATNLLAQAFGAEGLGGTLHRRIGSRTGAPMLGADLAAEIELALRLCERSVTQHLEGHRDALSRLSHALMDSSWLDGAGISAILADVPRQDGWSAES